MTSFCASLRYIATFMTWTRTQPTSSAGCGSPSLPVKAWCLRCTATHWRAWMPVVIQSRNLNTHSTDGASVTARWESARCRYTVVQTFASNETANPITRAIRRVVRTVVIGGDLTPSTYQ